MSFAFKRIKNVSISVARRASEATKNTSPTRQRGDVYRDLRHPRWRFGLVFGRFASLISYGEPAVNAQQKRQDESCLFETPIKQSSDT